VAAGRSQPGEFPRRAFGSSTGAGDYLGHNGGGGVGYGPGAAVGAAIAARDAGRFCVAIFGDGDYAMSASALWTAVHYRAPMLCVINNNVTWATTKSTRSRWRVIGIARRDNAWIGQRMSIQRSITR